MYPRSRDSTDSNDSPPGVSGMEPAQSLHHRRADRLLEQALRHLGLRRVTAGSVGNQPGLAAERRLVVGRDDEDEPAVPLLQLGQFGLASRPR